MMRTTLLLLAFATLPVNLPQAASVLGAVRAGDLATVKRLVRSTNGKTSFST